MVSYQFWGERDTHFGIYPNKDDRYSELRLETAGGVRVSGFFDPDQLRMISARLLEAAKRQDGKARRCQQT